MKNKETDYIVPIFHRGVFNGTGFIVGNMLITAAHVVVSEESLCYFLFGGEKITIGPDNNMIFEYPKGKEKQGKDNKYWDLAIFQLDNNYSPLELCIPNMTESCTYFGFTDSTLKVNTYTDVILENHAYYYPPEYEAKPVHIDNCYISVIGKCTHGNSGGPLFQGNGIVGMLSGGQQWHKFSCDRFIKAEYILNKIKDYDITNPSHKAINK